MCSALSNNKDRYHYVVFNAYFTTTFIPRKVNG